MKSVLEARALVLENTSCLPAQSQAFDQALGAFLAQDILADRPIPPFDRVAMDGYAVRAAEVAGRPQVTLRVQAMVQAGQAFDQALLPGQAIQIMTGSPLPPGADGVVMVEKSQRQGEQVTLSDPEMQPGHNVAYEGEDAALGQVLLAKGSKLSPAGLAVCASVGACQIKIYPKPSLAIVSTGTEILPPNAKPQRHQIRDCNSSSLLGLAALNGVRAEFLGIAGDQEAQIKAKIQEGLKSHVLLLTGGVSMGEFDLVPGILKSLGVKEVFHKVKLKPGKPLWFGVSPQGCLVFGLPGNPVSAQVNFKLFVEPALQKLMGNPNPEPFSLYLPLGQQAVKKGDKEFYLPARYAYLADEIDRVAYLEEIKIKGSGDFSGLALSDGLIRYPQGVTQYEEGAMVEFLPWSRP